MEKALFFEILNNLLANGGTYVSLALFLILLVRQIRFEQYCNRQFQAITFLIHEVERRLREEINGLRNEIKDIRNEIKDLRKDMNHGFQINDLKHDSFEEKIKKLES